MNALTPHRETLLRNLVVELEDAFGMPRWINVRIHGCMDTPWLKIGNQSTGQALTGILKRLNKAALSVTLVKNDHHVDLWGRDDTGKPKRLATIYHADLGEWSIVHKTIMDKEA